jgi:nucleotide-binding universal stress UspA family protein
MRAKRILVAIDDSPQARAALEHALDLHDTLGCSIDLVNVSAQGADSSREVVIVGDPSGGASLKVWLARPDRAPLSDLFSQLEERGKLELDAYLSFADVAQGIVAAAHGYDLLVMGTHGRRGLKRALQGSVAEEVVRSASCPVVTVRAAAR